MRIWIIIVFLVFFLPAQARAQTAPEVIYAIKPNPEIAAICAAEDGLARMWAREPEWNQRDIGFQYDGLKAQAAAAAAAPPGDAEPGAPLLTPVPLTFEEYRDAAMAQQCKVARDGLIETFENSLPFFGYSFWECDADWDEDCDDPKVIRAPDDYQICNISWRVAKQRGDSDFDVTPANFLADKPNRAARFLEYRTKLYAHGSHSLFDKEGSRIRLENFLVTIIPRDWPDDARRKLKCAMPGRPKPPTPTPTATPAPKPVPPVFGEAYADERRSYRFSLANVGKVPVRIEYLVERRDRGDSKWKQAGYGVVQVEPGTTYFSDGYHGWDAVEWHTRHAMVQ